MPTTEYNALLDLIAAHPGVDREDALETNGSHWVMRQGRFHPDEYDHPLTREWRERDT